MAGLAAVLSDTKKKDNKTRELLSLLSQNISHRGRKTKLTKDINGIKNGCACLLSNYSIEPESLENNDGSFTLESRWINKFSFKIKETCKKEDIKFLRSLGRNLIFYKLCSLRFFTDKIDIHIFRIKKNIFIRLILD